MEELYDKTSPESIERYAKKLLNTSLREYTHGAITQRFHGKGNLGQVLEEQFFHYNVNSRSEPDFAEAGVELKSTPMKTRKDGSWVAKERLVLNIINYMEEWKKSFKTSSFWHKNKHLLLMFYLWQSGQISIDYIFKIIRLWRFPANDLKIIKDDWNVIHKKILQGKAEDISESDTFYLAACPKGATKEENQRKQPFSNKKAMQRAYSLKTKYMNSIIAMSLAGIEPRINQIEIDWILDEWQDGMAKEPFEVYMARKTANNYEPIIKDINQYSSSEETFADYVEEQFVPYYGMTDTEIANKFGLKETKAKSKFWLLTKAILGIKKDKIEEFEKAGITVKTIRLNKNSKLKENMSFPTIRYKEIVNEDWEDSDFYNTLSNKFFFVVYQQTTDGSYRLRSAFFWNMPNKDLEEAQRLWLDTKIKIQSGDFTHFGKIKESNVCHVRPHGQNSRDLMEAPDGSMQKKYCFWLNRLYIYNIVTRHLVNQSKAETIDLMQTALVGYVASDKHLSWIQSKHIYNIRTGEARGATQLTTEMICAKYLILYRSGKALPHIYVLDEEGPTIWDKDKLISNGYPATPTASQYLVYHIKGETTDFKIDESKLGIGGTRFVAPFAKSIKELI